MNENFFAARAQLCEDLLPVTTIRPEAKSRAVARGSRRRMITAAKRRGLNSVLRQRRAICLRSRRTPRLAVKKGDWLNQVPNGLVRHSVTSCVNGTEERTSTCHILYPN